MAISTVDRRQDFVKKVQTPRIAWIVLVCGLILTIFAWYISSNFVEENNLRRFEQRSQEITAAIQARMLVYEQVLEGGVAFFGSVGDVDRRLWRGYVEGLKLGVNWPGIQGLGFAIPVAPQDLDRHIAGTGGSGRVPASYCGVTGLKPSPGALSRRGMVNACRSFDTISVYAKTPSDALDGLNVLVGYDAEDCFSDPGYSLTGCAALARPASEARIAVPTPEHRNFFGNAETEILFEGAVRVAAGMFGAIDDINFTPFLEINNLMFFGPFVAERDVAVGGFLRENPSAGDPVVRDIILKSATQTAADAYRAYYKIAETKRWMMTFWENYDALMVPTVGTQVTVEQVIADPLGPNFNNGYYTNFANPLGLAAIAVPHAVTRAGVPYGITFLGPPQSESHLVDLADRFSGELNAGRSKD